MLEEHENQETSLQDLIDLVERDDLPTNEFSIQDKDPMVILGKLNEVIAYLQTLQATINASDSKANEALQKAIQAVADATQALSVANGIDSKATQALANAIEAVSTANTALSASNTALSTANTAISTANTALSSANNAVETAGNALGTAESAETKADTAITTANGAKTTAEGIDNKATTALSNSQTAVSTANTADTKATQALATANTANATASTANETANTANDTANTALTNSSNALTTSDEANTKATQALATANTADATANNANNSATGAFSKASIAVTTANEAKATAEEALDQVVAGLGTKVYRDSQLLSTFDIKPIEDDIANNTTTINNEATIRANAVNALENNKADKSEIPTKTSQLTNDSSFATTSQIPTKTSQLTNDSNFATTSQLPDISGKANLSGGNTFTGTQIINGSDATPLRLKSNTSDTFLSFIDGSGTTLGKYGVNYTKEPVFTSGGGGYKRLAYESQIRTKTSQLTNDSDFVTTSDLSGYAVKDLSNVTYPANTKGSTTTGSGDRVIKTYISSDGKTWYRIWASGWKECGFIGITNTRNGTKKLPVTFATSKYTVIATYNYTTSENTPWYYNLYAEAYSVDYIRTGDFGGLTFNIYCCGY